MSPLTIDIRLVSAIYYSESTWKEVDESFIESLMKKEADGNDIQNFLNENVSTLVRLEDCMDENSMPITVWSVQDSQKIRQRKWSGIRKYSTDCRTRLACAV